MAESVVSVFVEKLCLLIENEATLLGGVKGQVESLRTELEFISQFLTDAEQKRKVIPMVDTWVKKIRDLSYDAEDIIDAFILKKDQERSRNIWQRIICFGSKVNTLRQIGKQIEQVNARSKEIAEYRSRYNLDVSGQSQQAVEHFLSRRRSNPSVEEPIIVGLHEEATHLVGWLMKEEDDHRRVMSIIGMGGLGKTTLARKVYNTKDVKNHFKTRAWISVSQEYLVKDILSNTLKQVNRTVTDEELARLDTEEVALELSKQLQGKRYLVVMDDIWEPEAWDQIGAAFPNNQNSSRVVLTTRNRQVTPSTDPSNYHHHELRLLTKVESWELLCRKVFPTSTSPPDDLVKLGQQIAEKCGGLPLAIVVLGGLLRERDMTHEAWSKVLASANWQLSRDSNQCRKILALSYADLPTFLKPCFLYLGLFPEDFEINVERLILMWVAEGFVQERGRQNMEDVAEDYFEELVQRSMIQVAERKYHGGPVATCRVHDLLRDLAISEGRKDGFLEIHGKTNSSSTTTSRRLAIHSFSRNWEEQNLLPNSGIHFRSLLFFNSHHSGVRWKATFWGRLKMIRVLSLENVAFREGLPKDASKLILLQYLDLRGHTVGNNLSWIGSLVKLQTLDLRGARWVTDASFILKMKQLRHLYMPYGCHDIRPNSFSQSMLASIGYGDVVVDELPRNLVRLHADGLLWMSMVGRFSKAFVQFNSLRSLKLYGPLEWKNQSLENCFPSSLIELFLAESELEQDPVYVLGGLPKLRILVLSNTTRVRSMTFSSQDFVQLQHLTLEGSKVLDELVLEDGALGSLKHLCISHCPSLKRIPNGFEKITNLVKLEFVRMTPTFEERVKENGEDWEKIKHVSFVTIKEPSHDFHYQFFLD